MKAKKQKLSSASPSSSPSFSSSSPSSSPSTTKGTMEPFATHLTPSGFALARVPKRRQEIRSPPDCQETDVDEYVRKIISTNPKWMDETYDKTTAKKWKKRYSRSKENDLDKVKDTEGVIRYAVEECSWRQWKWRDRCGIPVAIHKNDIVLAKDDGICQELRASMMEDIRRLSIDDKMAKSSTIAPHPRYGQAVLQIVHPSLYCYEKGVTAVLPGIGVEAMAMPKFSSFLGAKGVIGAYKSTNYPGEGGGDSKKNAVNDSSEDESSDDDRSNFSNEKKGSNDDILGDPGEDDGRNETLFGDSSEDEDSDDDDVELEPESNQNLTKTACKISSVYELDDSDESDDSDNDDTSVIAESSDFQWLPSEFFVSSVNSGSRLTDQKPKCHINSYINNLHPYKYKELYDKIGELFVKALPLLEELLTEINGENGKVRKQLPRFESARRPRTGAFIGRRPWMSSEDFRQRSKPMKPGQEPLIPKFKPPSYTAKATPVNLHDRPLQVIVKIVQWNLTPDNDINSEELRERFDGTMDYFNKGHWHVEGTPDERIVASACCYLDANNVSESKLEFRDGSIGSLGCEIGKVATTPGKIIAWPNYFHHRTGQFGLKGGNRPGSRTLCCFHLIDPTIRIRSTATVPPQQQSWVLDMVKTAMSVSPVQSISSSTSAISSKILSFLAAANSTSPVPTSATTASTTLNLSSTSDRISNDDGSAVDVTSTLTYSSAIERRERLGQERRAGGNVIANTFYEEIMED